MTTLEDLQRIARTHAALSQRELAARAAAERADTGAPGVRTPAATRPGIVALPQPTGA